MFDVRGKRVIITGGAQGLGKEFARRLLQEGCRVCISDVDVDKGGETVNLFQKQFGCAEDGLCFVKCDVSQKEEWIALWDSAVKTLDGPIDILVNNAGLHPGVNQLLYIFNFLSSFLMERESFKNDYNFTHSTDGKRISPST